MWHYASDFVSIDDFERELAELASQERTTTAHSLLFQLFSSSRDPDLMALLRTKISRRFPDALVMGASTSGEIANEAIYDRTTSFSAMGFETSYVSVTSYDCSVTSPVEAGSSLRHLVLSMDDVVAVEVLATTKGTDAKSFLSQLDTLPPGIVVFGGGADAEENAAETIVFDGERTLDHGVVVAIFRGQSLHVATASSLGWKPLSRAMRITETRDGGKTLVTVDGRPAVDIYRKYLHVGDERDLHSNVQEFPVLVERDGMPLTRVPIESEPDGSLVLGADVATDETLRISYADPSEILGATLSSAEGIAAFRPQALLAFCCITRKVYLKEYAGHDTMLFSGIAPLAGFYTYGEFIRCGSEVNILNCSLVIAALREGEGDGEVHPVENPDVSLAGHMALVQHLVHFVETTMKDLEDANTQLEALATHDRLTGLLNRGEVESRLGDELVRVRRESDAMSAIMLDVDDFKTVNDTYGHDAGDAVLREIADLVRTNVRDYDAVGRWGGEEFLVILYGSTIGEARSIAERVRLAIASHDFGEAGGTGGVTVSVGVAQALPSDDTASFYHRVDQALYDSKLTGKDRVSVR